MLTCKHCRAEFLTYASPAIVFLMRTLISAAVVFARIASARLIKTEDASFLSEGYILIISKMSCKV